MIVEVYLIAIVLKGQGSNGPDRVKAEDQLDIPPDLLRSAVIPCRIILGSFFSITPSRVLAPGKNETCHFRCTHTLGN